MWRCFKPYPCGKAGRFFTSDFTDSTDGKPIVAYPCHPCHPWLNSFFALDAGWMKGAQKPIKVHFDGTKPFWNFPESFEVAHNQRLTTKKKENGQKGTAKNKAIGGLFRSIQSLVRKMEAEK